ncbi:winged helix-turn-helix domain-containing protein [Streptomyces sp. NPDC006798]|uniref:GntR family transcriptional regulator n=1 Tax=Streptomyces sp. NPDC006798 TaxID=3155462 RepID=UPI0033CAA813
MEHDLDRTRPVWRQIAQLVIERIDDGTYPIGSRVPSVVELSTEFGVAASTAQKVLAHLKAERVVRAEIGIGTFVVERPESGSGQS